MVLRFTAKVKKRSVVVRDVDLPDGATVDVTIAAQPPDEEESEELTPEEWAMVREGLRAADRGEVFTVDEVFAHLRAASLYGHDYGARTSSSEARNADVGGKPRRRAKPAARRVRSRR
jgi:hypothetical protein